MTVIRSPHLRKTIQRAMNHQEQQSILRNLESENTRGEGTVTETATRGSYRTTLGSHRAICGYNSSSASTITWMTM
jgi:hypothetical protein